MTLLPEPVERQVLRALGCLADPECTERDAAHEFALAWGAVLALLRQAAEIRPTSHDEEQMLGLVVAALVDSNEALLHAHDLRSRSTYGARPGDAFLAEVRSTLADVSVLPGKTLDLDEPADVPASVARWVGALRHIDAELAAHPPEALDAEARDRLEADRAAAAAALRVLEQFWREIFELAFVARG